MHKVDKKLIALREEFKTYYNAELFDDYKQLESKRYKYLLMFIFNLILVIGINYFMIIWVNDGTISEDYNFVTTFDFVISYILLVFPCAKFKGLTKDALMKKIISFFGENIKYSKNVITDDIIKTSELFDKYNNSDVDDCFAGTYNGVKIAVSEYDLDNGSGKDKENVFDGLLILFDFSKNFSGKTKCKSKFNLSSLNNFGSWVVIGVLGIFCFIDIIFVYIIMTFIGICLLIKYFNNKSKKKIYLENVVFSKKWNVEATDQIEARYLLTPAMMERILEVKKLFKGKAIDFSFFDNKLLIAVHTNKDMFESTSLFSSALRFDKVMNVIHQFYSIFAIIDLLKIKGKDDEKS